MDTHHCVQGISSVNMGQLVIDIETDGDPWHGSLVSIAVADPDDPTTPIVYDSIPRWLSDALANPEVAIIEHTLYDARWLRLAGWEINGPVIDTRVMAWNVNENTDLDLESLVFRYLGYKMDKRLRQSKHGIMFKTDEGSYVPIAEVPRDQMDRYNGDDAMQTAGLFNRLKEDQPAYWADQIRLTGVLLDMECWGVPIDTRKLEWTRESLAMTRDSIRDDLTRDLPPGFNLNSGDQVSALLFLDEFELPGRVMKDAPTPAGFKPGTEGRLWVRGTYTVKGFGLKPGAWTDSGKRPKIDAKTLTVRHSRHPWVSQYLEYQTLDKLLGTYLDALPKYMHDNRLYGTFNQAGTVSGRLSSSNPNLQNIPRRGVGGAGIRELFAGNLVVADFSQLEPRLMAHWSQDAGLLEVYRSHRDIYKRTAKSIFGVGYSAVTSEQRDICKALVLSMGYGAQARKLAEILSVAGHTTTQGEAGRYLSAMQGTYPRFFEWREEIIAQSKSAGYVRTLAGRKRHIGYTGLESAWKAERQAVNSVIQGSAADIVNGTMLEVAKLESVRMLIQVHDELVCEYDDDPCVDAIRQAGETGHGFVLSVPLVFEPKVCETWGDK